MEYKGYTIETEWESDADCTYRIYNGESIIRRGGYFDHEYDAVEQAKLDIDCYPEKYTPDNRPPYPWVSVEDELPQEYVEVFAIWESNDKKNRTMERSSYYEGIWSIPEWGIPEHSHVTHWQYLPAFPE